MRSLLKLTLLPAALALGACREDQASSQPEPGPVRGLKTVLIEESDNSAIRRYPSVLQPSDTATLSFEISGRLGENSLDVGQRVRAGEVLVELDRSSLDLTVGEAEAALQQAQATAANAIADLRRKEQLWEKEVTTKANLDQARTAAQTSQAQVDQITKQLETAKENLSKAELKAPYDGIINSVSVNSFATVAAGTPVATLYNADSFEARFSVSYDIINRLAVGKSVTVRLADNPAISLDAQISELGSSADTVSSFPVIVRLNETHPDLKAGMAVEAAIEFSVTGDGGFVLPLTALIIEGQLDAVADPTAPMDARVFLYDAATQTVRQQAIKIIGIRENEIIATSGLKQGDRVASAGVPFLQEGQKVKLLATNK